MFGSGMNLITTIIGFGMSATFIVFVCTRLICARLRRLESRQMFEIGSRMEFEMNSSNEMDLLGWQPEHRINGLEPTVVAAIPTMKFDRDAFSSAEDAQCAICLGEYQEKEVLRIMPKCGHSFHLSCIDIWLRKQSTCPVCRLSVHDSIQTKYVRPTIAAAAAAGRTPSSFDNSDAEHSQLWLMHAGQRSEEATTTTTSSIVRTHPADSVTINVETSLSREAGIHS